MEYRHDPYTRRPEDAREPPQGFAPTLKFLGPSLILAGSVEEGDRVLVDAGNDVFRFETIRSESYVSEPDDTVR